MMSFGLMLICFVMACTTKQAPSHHSSDIELIVLGITQDAGYPQANCQKDCCTTQWSDKTQRKMVSCLGIKDHISKTTWMFDATPDFKDQLQLLMRHREEPYEIGGIFLTHAHMGHYTGLMHLGFEAMGADSIKVYTMPRMNNYLKTNGPWSQLVTLGNIDLHLMSDAGTVDLAEGRIKVTPFLVPHRDEYSETVGYKIETSSKSVLFIPDIDKWSKWDQQIAQLITEVDLAFLDGSFYRNGEIWGRDMSQIPHPFIVESMSLLDTLSIADKAKVHFIHLNHTNPLLNHQSEEYENFKETGFRLAEEEGVFVL